MKIDNVDVFDSFRKGKLNPQQEEEFKEKLQSDQEFSKSYSEYLELTSAVESKGLAVEMEKWHKELNQKNKLHFDRIVKFGIAAIIIILIWFLFSNRNDKKEPLELYATYYYPDPGVPTKMGNNEINPFIQGMVFYKMDDYEEALRIWSTGENLNDSLNYFKAQALMATGRNEEAKSVLAAIPDDYPLYQKAQWYLLLLELKNENIIEAEKRIEVLKSLDFRLDKISLIEDALSQE